MKVLLTLDYELFLGDSTGTVKKCLIDSLEAILRSVSPYGAKFSVFVDAAYLYRLKQFRDKYKSLRDDYDTICRQLEFLQKGGHEIQLHIHPQWFFSEFDGEKWNLDFKHYKLCDVEKDMMKSLFVDSKNLLDGILGKKTMAFRAGGFSAQPTELLVELFRSSGIKIDSSVCPRTSYDSDMQRYDYANAPQKSYYRFSKDICREDGNGEFLEVPFSMISVSPWFHWKLAFTKLSSKLGSGNLHSRIGDGQSVKTVRSSIVSRLTSTVMTMATIDEYKSSLLRASYKRAKEQGQECFCVLGHPKLATAYSVRKLGGFCKFVVSEGGVFVTISELYE